MALERKGIEHLPLPELVALRTGEARSVSLEMPAHWFMLLPAGSPAG